MEDPKGALQAWDPVAALLCSIAYILHSGKLLSAVDVGFTAMCVTPAQLSGFFCAELPISNHY